ncbi:MAG: reverse transcriptase domain-containing protein [Candidatus Peribacteraceae bacterium]|nr:reverse transcriptase domain-containing protein [Candidatus Peribacteraceae bacterium]MDD5742131.1 reverse transcriptase domain-containing protein [Candidatus Peribacteraceae bacterium]
MQVFRHLFEQITSKETLFTAWQEFRKGKQGRKDVQEFERKLEQNLFRLHRALIAGTYRHQSYSAFTICDPKQQRIHKASVQDRILHHAVFSVLNPIFEPTFIAHSFSCRKGKGTHRAVDALDQMLRSVSRNATRTCFVLKCDVHRFFASVGHAILLDLLGKKIKDDRAMQLLAEVVGSFSAEESGKGIPIGNLTSQLFANVYLNELDRFIKHTLGIKSYVRYTDDFVIVSHDGGFLRDLLPPIRHFLESQLRLALHPRKVAVRKYRQGIDFLGCVLLPHHRILRTKTKRRMFRKMQERLDCLHRGVTSEQSVEHSLQSYLGVLSHVDAFRLGQELRNHCWFSAEFEPFAFSCQPR